MNEIEEKWKAYWASHTTYKTTINLSKPKCYVLSMFPYPSSAGLHVGHPLGYVAGDVYSRFKRMQGFNVLQPMGFDAFGLPAEQYAIKTGQHPAITTQTNIEMYRTQLDKIGLGYDWDRQIETCDPKYYKWTQWIFTKLYNSWYNPVSDRAEPIETAIANIAYETMSEKERHESLSGLRLAYFADVEVNWCDELKTVLANDEVINGFSERGGYPVVKKKMKNQWCLRISAYKERLCNGLDALDWSDSVKTMQRNWIDTLRDAVFSRQRYWGEPFPIYYKEGLPYTLPEEELPLLLPPITDFTPSDTGESPLAKLESWTYNGYPLETNTMPSWAGSSWYYLRYMDPTNADAFVGADALAYWKQIDVYIGGTEHTTGHLLYFRFWTKFLYDLGYISFDEPAKRLVNQGMILGDNGEKMSKSKGNVINPDDVIAEHGADSFRVYEMFLGPLELNKPWNTENISGSVRFVKRYAALYELVCDASDADEDAMMNKTIASYTHDIERFGMNTCISTLMKVVGYVNKTQRISRVNFTKLTQLIAPFAPFIAEEMWEKLGGTSSVFDSTMPVCAAVGDTKEYGIMVNGKKVAVAQLSRTATKDELESYASQYAIDNNITAVRIIAVPGKIINIIS